MTERESLNPNRDVRYAFVQHGAFSRVNENLWGHLATEMGTPGELVDLAESRRIGRKILLNGPPGNLMAIVRERRSQAFLRPGEALASRRNTAYMFQWRSRCAQRALGASRWDFVFQTQTVFDASLPSVPFFMFTDHTVLANRRYGGGFPKPRWSPHWVDMETRAYRRADKIFAVSAFAKASLVEDYGCASDAVVVVGSAPNVIAGPRPAALREPGDSERGPTILFVGVEWRRKGGPLLLAAFRRLRRRHPRLVLRIVGCEPRVRDDGVEVVGRLEPARLAGEYERADIFCMPSWIEPAAVAYLEASSFGLPVVATDTGATPERVLEGRTGLLCRPGDEDGLVSRLSFLLERPDEALRMGAEGQRFAARFTWTEIAAAIAHEIRDMLPA